MDLVKIGKLLQALRKEKGLTQEQLAEKVGVARRTVSRWETGSNMADLDVLIELSDFYEVDLREILNGERSGENVKEDVKEAVRQAAEYGSIEKDVKRKRLNRDFILGGLCIVLVLLDHQFGILSLIFRTPIDSFVAGALTGLGLLFEFVGFYNNNHPVSLTQRKRQLLTRKES